MLRLASLGLLGLAACLLLASASAAQTEDTSPRERSRRALALAGDLMSPFCPGRTLADCPSPDAAVWREDIRTWMNAGLPDAEIRTRLQARMPEQNLSALPRGPLGWMVPSLILVAGLGILTVALRRVTAASDEPELDPELEEKLLSELESER